MDRIAANDVAESPRTSSDGRPPQDRISLRFWQSECLSRRTRAFGDREAHRGQIRLYPGAARWRLQGDRQPLAGRIATGIKNKGEYQALETARFIRRHNITTFKPNPFFPVNTLMLMRGAVAARFENMFEKYFRAAYHHMWEEPKKMDDPETFKAAFVSSGIDIDRLIARAQQDDVKKKLIDNTSDAVARGEFGSPTFFVGTEMFFGKDQLRDVEESIVEQLGALRASTT
jgi:2-hydroxychromene-2-carboxylate isomerase